MAETQTGKMINQDISNPEHRRINKPQDKIITEMRRSSKKAAEELAHAGLDLSHRKERRRPCANCGRVRTMSGHGLCWSCYQVYRKNKDDSDLPDLMAAVKERVHSPAFKACPTSRKGRKAAEIIQPTAPAERGLKNAPVKGMTLSSLLNTENTENPVTLGPYKIEIEVAHRDLEMIDKFKDMCIRDRRTMGDEILKIIERTVGMEEHPFAFY